MRAAVKIRNRIVSIPQLLYAIEQTYLRNSHVYFGFTQKDCWTRWENYSCKEK